MQKGSLSGIVSPNGVMLDSERSVEEASQGGVEPIVFNLFSPGSDLSKEKEERDASPSSFVAVAVKPC
jgi:hypothetical protein